MAKKKGGGACQQWSVEGRCRFGDTCKFKHTKAPIAKGAKAASAAQGSSGRTANGSGVRQSVHTPPIRAAPVPVNGRTSNGAAKSQLNDRQLRAQQRPPLSPDAEHLFPPCSAILSAYSDVLLFCTRPLPFEVIESTLNEAARYGNKITSAAEASPFVAVLLTSSAAFSSGSGGHLSTRVAELLQYPHVAAVPKRAQDIPFLQVYLGVIGVRLPCSVITDTQYFTSEGVLKSGAASRVNDLYGLVDCSLPEVLATISQNVEDCISARSFRSSPAPANRLELVHVVTGVQVFQPIVVFLHEYLDRYPDAIGSHPSLADFPADLELLFEDWASQVAIGRFDDALVTRVHEDQLFFFESIRKDIVLLRSRVEHGGSRVTARHGVKKDDQRLDAPGHLSALGPRHSNDKADIRQIRIKPTLDEIMSERMPYLPVNMKDSEHHLPEGSMDKLLDVQFRIFRADAMEGLTSGLRQMLADLASPLPDSQLTKCLQEGGGVFTANCLERDTCRLFIMTGLTFVGVSLSAHHGLVVEVEGDAPPHPQARSRNTTQRKIWWEDAKRLQQGSLVGIVTHQNDKTTVAVATLTMDPEKFGHADRGGRATVRFGLNFEDRDEGLAAVESLTNSEQADGVRFVVESPVLFESARPFLQALQRADPINMPMARYLPFASHSDTAIHLPAYARLPGFTWTLDCLLREDSPVKICKFNPRVEESVAQARAVMRAHGRLDPSQSDSIIDTLTREVALIQGPPGTGKTFTGVELVRVLTENGVGPIVTMAQTNHALDHFLRSIIDRNVTQNLVRLGGEQRIEDPVVAQKSIKNVEAQLEKDPYLSRAIGSAHRQLRILEEETSDMLASLQLPESEVLEYLDMKNPALGDSLRDLPMHGSILFNSVNPMYWREGAAHDGHFQGSKWDFWTCGVDLQYLAALDDDEDAMADELAAELEGLAVDGRAARRDVDNDSDYGFPDEEDYDNYDDYLMSGWQAEDMAAARPAAAKPKDEDDPVAAPTPPVMARPPNPLVDLPRDCMPPVPDSRRSFAELMAATDIWAFSMDERRRFARRLVMIHKQVSDEGMIEKIKSLYYRYEAARPHYIEAQDNMRIATLQQIDLIGATTNGASKLRSVIKGFSPKVLLVEEAGQVLEAHVLAALFPTIEHVIMLGDPMQLRANVNLHGLSTDNKHGGERYRFDVSLMERLSDQGLPMSQLQVQRRMAPNISSLIRNTLYPKLQNAPSVLDYPSVPGMKGNLFFLNHDNPESRAGENDSSKVNKYEADMACGLATYLLKQECYSATGDIVILCAYAGQRDVMQKKLAGKSVSIRDHGNRDWIEKSGLTTAAPVDTPTEVKVDERVLVRTIDNFQGEEAKVIILSLVRNRGQVDVAKRKPFGASIGFLETINRLNVAISRAKHGMFIMGNADQFAAARSDMLPTIIAELTDSGAIGHGFQTKCGRHGTVCTIAEAELFDAMSPYGGCTEPCGGSLPGCGHPCPRTCHVDDPEHERVDCEAPCERRHDQCGHKCSRKCSDECGPCLAIKRNVELACGHKAHVECYQLDDLDAVRCPVEQYKQLPTCEHSAFLPCVVKYKCTEPCGQPLRCCQEYCTALCYQCQKINEPPRFNFRTNQVNARPGRHDEPLVEPQMIWRKRHWNHACKRAPPSRQRDKGVTYDKPVPFAAPVFENDGWQWTHRIDVQAA